MSNDLSKKLKRHPVTWVVIALGGIGVLLAITIPSFVKSRNTASQRACIKNMRLIDAGKDQWAIKANNMDNKVPKEIKGIVNRTGIVRPFVAETTPPAPPEESEDKSSSKDQLFLDVMLDGRFVEAPFLDLVDDLNATINARTGKRKQWFVDNTEYAAWDRVMSLNLENKTIKDVLPHLEEAFGIEARVKLGQVILLPVKGKSAPLPETLPKHVLAFFEGTNQVELMTADPDFRTISGTTNTMMLQKESDKSAVDNLIKNADFRKSERETKHFQAGARVSSSVGMNIIVNGDVAAHIILGEWIVLTDGSVYITKRGDIYSKIINALSIDNQPQKKQEGE